MGAVEHAGAMEIFDTDGDYLRSQVDSSGSLQESLHGQLEIDRLTELHYFDRLEQAGGELAVAFEGCLSVDGSRRRLVRACEAIRSLLKEGSEALRGVAAEGLLRLAAEEVEEFLVSGLSGGAAVIARPRVLWHP